MLEASLVVHYDDQAPGQEVMNRRYAVRALANYASGLAADTVNPMLSPSDEIDPTKLRSTVGPYVVRPRVEVPVQIDVELILAPDRAGVLLRRIEEVRLVLATRLLDWFQQQHTEFPEFYHRMGLYAFRLTLWVASEVLRLEINPAMRQVISSDGGRPYPVGYIIESRQFG